MAFLHIPFTRRQFLALSGSLAANAAIFTGLDRYLTAIEPGRLELIQLELTLPRLNREFDGLHLAQISDIHIDELTNGERLGQVVELINDWQPELVVVTGDLISRDSPPHMDDLRSCLGRLQPQLATLAVLGNHDHREGAGAVRQLLADAGVRDISNNSFSINRSGQALHFAGVDDVAAKRDRLDQVLERLPGEGAAILLAHEPDFADTAAAAGRFDLQLSGHSHGGQVRLPLTGPLLLPPLGRKYPAGLYQVGGMQLYTNRGLGMSHAKLRLNCPPEITLITLKTPPLL